MTTPSKSNDSQPFISKDVLSSTGHLLTLCDDLTGKETRRYMNNSQSLIGTFIPDFLSLPQGPLFCTTVAPCPKLESAALHFPQFVNFSRIQSSMFPREEPKREMNRETFLGILVTTLAISTIIYASLLERVTYFHPTAFMLTLLGIRSSFLYFSPVLPAVQSEGSVSISSDNNDDKVGICHRTGSASSPYVFMEVDRSAVPAHQEHGDIIDVPSAGQCPKGAPNPSEEPLPTPTNHETAVRPPTTVSPSTQDPTAAPPIARATNTPFATTPPSAQTPATSSATVQSAVTLPPTIPPSTQDSITVLPTAQATTIMFPVTLPPTQAPFTPVPSDESSSKPPTKQPRATPALTTVTSTQHLSTPTPTQEPWIQGLPNDTGHNELGTLKEQLLEKEAALEKAKEDLVDAEKHIAAGEEAAQKEKIRLEEKIENLSQEIDALKNKLINTLENENAALEVSLYKEVHQENEVLRWTVILAILAMITQIWPKEIAHFFQKPFRKNKFR